MVCMVSGVHFRDGTLAHWVTQSVGVSLRTRRLKRLLLSIPLILMCVCVWMWTHVVCIHKAHFPSSPCSVVSLVRLSRGASESLASDYTLGTAVTALLCGCSVIKLNFYFHQTASWLWLVWTNSPVFTPKMADDHDVK